MIASLDRVVGAPSANGRTLAIRAQGRSHTPTRLRRQMAGSRIPLDVKLEVTIQRQPDDPTCGPTCLDAVYHYYRTPVPLAQVIREIHRLEHGGTIAPFLGCHALKRGFEVTLYTWDLNVFDPSWIGLDRDAFREKLLAHAKAKADRRTATASRAYAELSSWGVRFRDLTAPLLRGLIRRKIPVIAGLSSTYLHRAPREFGPRDIPDDLRGEPAGHFVVLSGYRRQDRLVRVSDPYYHNAGKKPHEWVNINRLICAVLLGTLTFDANLLAITRPRTVSR
jgi:hypothetical protein